MSVYGDCVRSRMFGCSDCGRHSESEGSHVGCGTTAMLQGLGKQPGAGSFAVGAGDANDRNRGRRLAEETIGDGADVLAQLRNGCEEDVGPEVRHSLSGCRFVQHCTGAQCNCLLGELETVVGSTAAC